MVKSKARVINVFGKTLIQKRNPWYSERLRNALLSIGKKPKSAETILATPPPWFMNPANMPEAVYERARLFSEIASKTAGRPIEERLKMMQQALATGRKPRQRKAKRAGQRFHELYPRYEALRGEIAPVAPIRPVITA